MLNKLEEELKKLIPLTRGENGCLDYTMNYSGECKNTIIMIEQFKDKEAFDHHTQQSYLNEFIKKLPDLIEEASVHLCRDIKKL